MHEFLCTCLIVTQVTLILTIHQPHVLLPQSLSPLASLTEVSSEPTHRLKSRLHTALHEPEYQMTKPTKYQSRPAQSVLAPRFLRPAPPLSYPLWRKRRAGNLQEDSRSLPEMDQEEGNPHRYTWFILEFMFTWTRFKDYLCLESLHVI